MLEVGAVQAEMIGVVGALLPALSALVIASSVLRANRAASVQSAVGIAVGIFVAFSVRGAAERLSGVRGVPVPLLVAIQLGAVALVVLGVARVAARFSRRLEPGPSSAR